MVMYPIHCLLRKHVAHWNFSGIVLYLFFPPLFEMFRVAKETIFHYLG